jgi:hypothetical protein
MHSRLTTSNPIKNDPRPVKATREKIKTLAGALLIEASAQEVDASMLDGQGYYRQPKV